MRSNAPTVKNVRDPPDAQSILGRNLLLSDMTAVSQLFLIRNHHKNFTLLLYIVAKHQGNIDIFHKIKIMIYINDNFKICMFVLL